MPVPHRADAFTVSARVLSMYVLILYALCNVELTLSWCLLVSSGSMWSFCIPVQCRADTFIVSVCPQQVRDHSVRLSNVELMLSLFLCMSSGST
jgi:hypothetical protein